MTYSVTPPYEPLSVSPIVKIRQYRYIRVNTLTIGGVSDPEAINYVLSLQPVPSVDQGEAPAPRVVTMPDHFFLDDLVLITMGHNDAAMTSTVVEMSDVLGGHSLCDA